MIHPTAIIDPSCELAEDCVVGPYTIIREQVTIGPRTVVCPHVTIDPYVTIGEDCKIFQYASIGAEPQALKFKGEVSYLKIGRGTIIREFATVNRGTEFGGGVTEIGDENFLMAYTHVAHDCRTGKGVILANNATLAGHILIDDFATVGGLVAIHQFVRIGKFAYVGGKSAVPKDIPPFVIASGDRARLHGLNNVGLKRHGFQPATIAELKKAYRIIFRIGLTLNEALERVSAEVEPLPEVEMFVDFIKSSQRGITR
jgi:UDP-N-acetylglucosamine acyltransferase